MISLFAVLQIIQQMGFLLPFLRIYSAEGKKHLKREWKLFCKLDDFVFLNVGVSVTLFQRDAPKYT